MVKSEDKSLAWLLLASLALIWGSSFILMKKGLISFSPEQVASLRMAAACVTLLPFVAGKFSKVKRHQWKYIFASGMLGNLFPAFLFANAQTMISSSVAGMLNSLTPVFVLIVGFLLFKSRPSGLNVAGVFIGLLGAVGLILARSKGIHGENNWYGLLLVVACICYAFSVNILRNFLYDQEPLVITAFAMLFAGVPAGIYLFTTDFTEKLVSGNDVWFGFFCIVTLGVAGSAISTVMFNRLLKISTALYASSVTYLIPIVALMWGVIDGEILNVVHFFAFAAILGGVYLINKN